MSLIETGLIKQLFKSVKQADVNGVVLDTEQTPHMNSPPDKSIEESSVRKAEISIVDTDRKYPEDVRSCPQVSKDVSGCLWKNPFV